LKEASQFRIFFAPATEKFRMLGFKKKNQDVFGVPL
jgi:hypothetical protein